MVKRIYKKDSSGKIRYLEITAEDNFVVTKTGVLGSEVTVINKSACEAKNIGKSNATTPQQQAILEIQSKISEKMRLGYFDTVEEALEKGGANFLLPMLAKDYKKEFAKVKFPCFVQPKLDGMRALYNKEEGFMSRTGKEVDTINHISIPGFDEVFFDGELYAHGISFQENMKLIKKYRKGETEKVKYHIYDIVSPVPFSMRLNFLNSLEEMESIEVVPTHLVKSKEEMLALHQVFISEGYEGTIIRHSNEGYQVNKRSTQLLKYKDFIDEAYEVINVVPSESRPEQGVIVCQGFDREDNAFTFNCGMKFSHSERQEILTNKQNYIGKTAEVRFFEYTDAGIPRFPVCVGFRLDK